MMSSASCLLSATCTTSASALSSLLGTKKASSIGCMSLSFVAVHVDLLALYFSVGVDAMHPTNNMFIMGQGGLSLDVPSDYDGMGTLFTISSHGSKPPYLVAHPPRWRLQKTKSWPPSSRSMLNRSSRSRDRAALMPRSVSCLPRVSSVCALYSHQHSAYTAHDRRPLIRCWPPSARWPRSPFLPPPSGRSFPCSVRALSRRVC